jgi:endonuclease/exonuclease/phosphatase (EEP) superfamily protein YafD
MWTRRLIAAIAGLYLVTLLGAFVALRWVGERWWVTGLALYVPPVAFGAPLPVIVALVAWARAWRWLWTQAAAFVAVVFGLMAFALPTLPSGAHGAPVVRVLSYNINSGNGGTENVVAEVDRYSPDIAALQEVSDLGALGRLLNARYPTVVTEGQFVLATRYRLVSSLSPQRLPFYGRERSPRFMKYVLETPLGQVAFYNVHPISPREDFYAIRGNGLKHEILSGRIFSPAGAGTVQANSGLRTLQVQTFADAATGETLPVVIAGDTNLPALSPVLRRYLSRFQDAFGSAGGGFGYTFPADRVPWMRIDRILASDALRFTRFEVGRSRASDHLCVVADVAAR